MQAEILFIPSTSAPAPAPLCADLNVAVVPAADSAGFFVALHEGLFAARGLHVKFMPAISSETVINAQALGEAMEALPAPLGLTKVQAAVIDDATRARADKRRGDHNRLGFALQLGTARFLGTFLPDPLDVPWPVVEYPAEQLGVADVSVAKRYAERLPTQHEHAREIRQAYGYRDLSDPDAAAGLREFLDGRAWTHAEGPYRMFGQAVGWLRRNRVLLPGVSVLARLVASVRDGAGSGCSAASLTRRPPPIRHCRPAASARPVSMTIRAFQPRVPASSDAIRLVRARASPSIVEAAQWRASKRRESPGARSSSCVQAAGPAGRGTAPLVAERADEVQSAAGLVEGAGRSRRRSSLARVGDRAQHPGPGLEQAEPDRPPRPGIAVPGAGHAAARWS